MIMLWNIGISTAFAIPWISHSIDAIPHDRGPTALLGALSAGRTTTALGCHDRGVRLWTAGRSQTQGHA